MVLSNSIKPRLFFEPIGTNSNHELLSFFHHESHRQDVPPAFADAAAAENCWNAPSRTQNTGTVSAHCSLCWPKSTKENFLHQVSATTGKALASGSLNLGSLWFGSLWLFLWFPRFAKASGKTTETSCWNHVHVSLQMLHRFKTTCEGSGVFQKLWLTEPFLVTAWPGFPCHASLAVPKDFCPPIGVEPWGGLQCFWLPGFWVSDRVRSRPSCGRPWKNSHDIVTWHEIYDDTIRDPGNRDCTCPYATCHRWSFGNVALCTVDWNFCEKHD